MSPKSPFEIHDEGNGVFRVYVYHVGLHPTGTREDAERLLRSVEYERKQWNAKLNEELDDLRGLLRRAVELFGNEAQPGSSSDRPCEAVPLSPPIDVVRSLVGWLKNMRPCHECEGVDLDKTHPSYPMKHEADCDIGQTIERASGWVKDGRVASLLAVGAGLMKPAVHTCPAGSVSLDANCGGCVAAFGAGGSKRDYPWKTPDGNASMVDERGPRQAQAAPGSGKVDLVAEETARCINIVAASPADLTSRRWIMRAIVGREVVSYPRMCICPRVFENKQCPEHGDASDSSRVEQEKKP